MPERHSYVVSTAVHRRLGSPARQKPDGFVVWCRWYDYSKLLLWGVNTDCDNMEGQSFKVGKIMEILETFKASFVVAA